MEKVLGIEREEDRVRRVSAEGVEKFKEKHGGEGFFREAKKRGLRDEIDVKYGFESTLIRQLLG